MHDGYVSTNKERVLYDEQKNRSCGFKARPMHALYTADQLRTAIAAERAAHAENYEFQRRKADLATATVYQFHYAMKDVGWHPGRTDDNLCDIIRAKGAELSTLRQQLERTRPAPLSDERIVKVFLRAASDRAGFVTLEAGKPSAYMVDIVRMVERELFEGE